MAGRKKRKPNILDELPPDLSLQCLPSALRDKLMPFQREGVKFALRKNGRCLIGDEMGLGKTLQAIAVAYHYRQEWPVLVVVPSSLRYQWVEELERWVPDLEPTHIHVVSSRDDIRNISTAQVTILGYGLIQRQDQPLVKALHDQNFQVIIVDESHYLKNRKAVRTQGLVPLVKNAKRALLLTGTPALARPAELFPQVDALLPGKFGSWTKFSKRYCNAHQVFYGRFSRWDTNGASNLAELHSNLQPLMIRRLKAQVLTQLPPKRRQRIPFDVPEGEHKKDLDKLAAEWRDLIGRGAVPQSHDQQGMPDNPSFRIRQLITEWYHTTALAKAGSVQEYIKVLLENESMKFIVFGHHKHMLQAVTQTLIHSKVKYIRIDGSVPSAERTHLVQQFQADPTVKVAVLSILAAGTGLTLTAASHVVFAELYWTPGVLEQAEDRAHRIGQHSAVHVHYLVARNTIDDWMWSMLTRKVSVVTSTLNGKLAVLQAEECDEDQAEFLSRAAVWLPGEQQEEEDSFFFTQPNTQKDLRSYFKPKSGKGQKAQPSDKQKHNSGTESVSLIQDDDDDGTDFRDVQKTHRAARPQVFVIDSDTESTADESEKASTTAHLWLDGNMERDASSSSDDTIIETNQTIEDSSSLIGQEAEAGSDLATPKISRSADTSSVGEKKAEGLSSRRVGNDVKETGWGCPLCTFQNHELLKVCEMCETPRKKEKPTTRSQQRQHDSDFSSPTLGVTKARNMRSRGSPSCALGTPDTKAVEEKTVTDTQEEGLLSVVQEREKPCIDTPTKSSSSHSIQNTPTSRSRESPFVKKPTLSDSELAESVSNIQNNNADIVDLTMYSTTEEDDTTCESDTTTEQTVATPLSKVTSHESQKENIPKKAQSDILFCSTPPTVRDSSLESSIAEELAVAAEVFKPSPCRGKTTWQCENSSCGYRNADSDAEDCDACFSPRPRKRLKLSSTESPQSSLGGTATPSLKTAGTKGTPSRVSNSIRKPGVDITRSPSLQKAAGTSSTSKIVHSTLSTPGRKDTSTLQGGKPKLQFQMNKANIPSRFEATSTPPSKKSHKNLSSPFASSPASGSVSSSPLQGSDWFDEDDISDDMLLSSEKSMSPRGHIAGSASTAGKSGGSMYDLENFSMNADIGTEEGDVDCGSKDPVVKLEDVPVYEELQFCASMHTDRIYLYDVDDLPLSCNFSVLDVEQRNMDSLPPLLHQPGNWRLVLRMVQEWNRLSEPKKRVVRRSGRMFISPSLLAEELSQSQRRKAACKNQRFMSKEDFMQRAFKVAEREGGTVQVVSRQRRPSSTVSKPGQLQTSSDKPAADSTSKQEFSTVTAAASSSDSCTADSAVEDIGPTGQQEGDETRLRGQLQVVDSAGRSLCLWCQKPVSQQQSGLATDTEGASSHVRPSRYCSTECKEEYRIRMKGSHHSRQQLRDTEFGVCQICGTNMRQIFQQVKDLPMSERKVFLKTTPLSSLPTAQLNKIIADPKEGQFWHADHIVPVADGGGLCSLDNFRTLCVACHRKVTTQQNRERRSAQKQERRSQDGYRSIMDFIKR